MKNGLRYIADASGDPVACDDFEAWTNWFHHADRQLAFHKVGTIRISTTFLGIDQGLGTTDKPLLWETLVADADWGRIFARRYMSKRSAIEGHGQVVTLLRREQAPTTGDHVQKTLTRWAKSQTGVG